jgi:hypothetical protein
MGAGASAFVGETGRQDFVVAHPSADPQEIAARARGAFGAQDEVLGREPHLHSSRSGAR